MKQLNQFIQEKLKVNSNSKVNTKRDLTNVDYEFVDNSLYFETSTQEKRCYHLINLKKAKNDYQSLLKTKEVTKLLRYWFVCIGRNGWLEGAKALRGELITRGFSEDELDAYILSKYNRYKGFNDIESNFEEYLDDVHVKYKKHEK